MKVARRSVVQSMAVLALICAVGVFNLKTVRSGSTCPKGCWPTQNVLRQCGQGYYHWCKVANFAMYDPCCTCMCGVAPTVCCVVKGNKMRFGSKICPCDLVPCCCAWNAQSLTCKLCAGSICKGVCRKR
jgi:hypothetical protein